MNFASLESESGETQLYGVKAYLRGWPSIHYIELSSLPSDADGLRNGIASISKVTQKYFGAET